MQSIKTETLVSERRDTALLPASQFGKLRRARNMRILYELDLFGDFHLDKATRRCVLQIE